MYHTLSADVVQTTFLCAEELRSLSQRELVRLGEVIWVLSLACVLVDFGKRESSIGARFFGSRRLFLVSRAIPWSATSSLFILALPWCRSEPPRTLPPFVP